MTLCVPTLVDNIPRLIQKYGDVNESVMPDVMVDQTYEDYGKGIDTIYERILEDTK